MQKRARLLFKRKFTLIIGLGALSLLLFFIITSLWIGKDVKAKCREAKKEYGGDCVGALILLLDDQGKDFRLRNSAVWALGQLGDGRALDSLKRYYTGNISNKEFLDQSISQHELKKAISLTSGGLNITSFLWR